MRTAPSKTPSKERGSLRFGEMVSEGSLEVQAGVKSLVPALVPVSTPREAFGMHTLHRGRSWEGTLGWAPPPGAAGMALGTCTICF